MKPFNLEAFKAGKPALTRKGQRAEFVGYCKKAVSQPLVAHIEGQTCTQSFRDCGRWLGSRESSLDLTHMAPEETTYWVNVYKTSSGETYPGQDFHASKKEAEDSKSLNWLGAFPVIIKE